MDTGPVDFSGYRVGMARLAASRSAREPVLKLQISLDTPSGRALIGQIYLDILIGVICLVFTLVFVLPAETSET